MAESLKAREDQALYEVEHDIAQIIGPTAPGAAGFYQMMGAQQHLAEYREAIERRVRAEERQRYAALEGAAWSVLQRFANLLSLRPELAAHGDWDDVEADLYLLLAGKQKAAPTGPPR